MTYQLNALGQRYQKTFQGTTTAYLYGQSGRLIAETADAGQTHTQYVWLADTPVAVIKPTTPSPTLYFIHNDHLDTPRVLTNQSQQTVWRWDNDDPFGANMANENPSGLGTFAFNLRFPGQYFDNETNNHYNYYRDYSPEIGRYLQSDPIGLRGGLNTYSYAYDDPLGSSDPMGLVPGAGPKAKTPRSPLTCAFGVVKNATSTSTVSSHARLRSNAARLFPLPLASAKRLRISSIPETPIGLT